MLLPTKFDRIRTRYRPRFEIPAPWWFRQKVVHGSLEEWYSGMWVTVLVSELMDYEITVNERAHAGFNETAGKHGDLVIALALSCGIERSVGSPTSRSYLHDREPSLEEWAAHRDRVRH